MSNVLPKETIDIVWRVFYHRLILAGALMFLALALFAWLLLLPSYLAPQIERGLLAQEEASATSTDADIQSITDRNDLIRSRIVLTNVSGFVSATTSATELLTAALLSRPSRVKINHITFISGADGRILLEGTAPGREEISAYGQALSKNPIFTGVMVPVGALVGADGGKFTVTLSGESW